MKRFRALFIAIATLGATSLSPAAFGALGSSAPQDTRAELKQRFAERYPELLRLKRDGKVGETVAGYVAVVEERFGDEDEVAEFIDAENADRKKLYALLVDDVKSETPPDKRDLVTAEFVAQRNARRNFRTAKDFEYLMVAKDVWIQKEHESRYDRLNELKEDGAVGETDEGLIAARSESVAAADQRLIDAENRWREERYEAIAKGSRSTPEEVAENQAEARIEAEPDDHYVRSVGEWTLKRDL